MIEILASQRTEIGARIVGNCSLGIQINAPTRFDQAFVEFRIFVVCEGLIIAAKLEEDLAIERRMMAVLNEPGATLHAVQRAPIAEPAVLCSRNGSLNAGRPFGTHRHDDGRNLLLRQRAYAPLDELGG
jgi:hypothetical protein